MSAGRSAMAQRRWSLSEQNMLCVMESVTCFVVDICSVA